MTNRLTEASWCRSLRKASDWAIEETANCIEAGSILAKPVVETAAKRAAETEVEPVAENVAKPVVENVVKRAAGTEAKAASAAPVENL